MVLRYGLIFCAIILLSSFLVPASKEVDVQSLIKIIESSDSEVIEEVELIPQEIFNELNSILEKKYKGKNPEPEFVLNSKYSAPSRGYRLNSQSFRRLNFAIRKGKNWLISYHVTNKRLSYNNVIFVSIKKKKSIIRSFQINRGSHNPESLLAKLQSPEAVELLYPGDYESSQVIF